MNVHKLWHQYLVAFLWHEKFMQSWKPSQKASRKWSVINKTEDFSIRAYKKFTVGYINFTPLRKKWTNSVLASQANVCWTTILTSGVSPIAFTAASDSLLHSWGLLKILSQLWCNPTWAFQSSWSCIWCKKERCLLYANWALFCCSRRKPFRPSLCFFLVI